MNCNGTCCTNSAKKKARLSKLRRKIEGLFKSQPNKTWYYSTLCDATDGDLEDVVMVCRALVDEKKVFVQVSVNNRRPNANS